MRFHNCRRHSNASGGRWGNDVRNAIQKSLQKKYALIGKEDFEFKKVRHKTVTDPELAPNLSFSYPVIKKIVGQGVLYIQLKAGLEFYYKWDSEDESDFLFSRVNEEIPPTATTQKSSSSQNIPSDTNMNQGDSVVLSSSINKTELSDESKQFINDIKEKNLQTPLEILKFIQKTFFKGRTLDVADINTDSKGKQTIFVWSEKTFTSLHLQNWSQSHRLSCHIWSWFLGRVGQRLRWTKEGVDSLSEQSYQKNIYFDKGLLDFLADEYFFVCIMVAIALFQNGQLPVYPLAF